MLGGPQAGIICGKKTIIKIADLAKIDIDQNQTLVVNIPSGIMNGTIITLKTREQRLVNVKVKEVNDTKFVRDGYNLIVYLDLPLNQVLNGDNIIMGHFNTVLSIPTKIPHSNYRHIVVGSGMPIPNNPDIKFGDLYGVYNVLFE